MYNIMVVDDSEMDLTFLKSIVAEALPFEKFIHCFKNSEKALSSLNDNEYQLIITDIEMPDINGFDFIELIKSQPKTKVKPIIVAVSGSIAANNANDTILYAANKIGADYTVSKRNLYFDLNSLLKSLF